MMDQNAEPVDTEVFANVQELNVATILENLENGTIEEKVFSEDDLAPHRRPDITHLKDAIVGGKLLVDVGDNIVIERYAQFTSQRYWLDTRLCKVLSMDDTGLMKLLDVECGARLYDNWKQGPSQFGTVYKIPPVRGSYAKSKTRMKKLKKAHKNAHALDEEPVQKSMFAPVENGAHAGENKPRGRGRPKGQKNRPKEVRDAERKEKQAIRAAKKAERMTAKNLRRKVASVARAERKVAKDPTPTQCKKRGRKPGTKNRTKEEREAAKRILLQERDARREARNAKKLSKVSS